MPAPRATGEKTDVTRFVPISRARCVWVILMPVADAAAAAAAAGAAVVAAACVATINCHNFCAAIPQALSNFHRRASLPHLPVLPLPSSYSFLSHSQKKRTKYCRSQISFESASKLPLVALYWMAVVACCRHRALHLPLRPSSPIFATTRNCRLYSPGTKLAFKVFQLNV